MTTMKKVSILVPCFNEEQSLPRLYERLVALFDALPQYDWEVLLVNDGSRDGTLDCIRALRQHDKRVCYIDLSRNFGKECAMLAGFDHVAGDCVIVLDADLQQPPETIPQMLDLWEQGYEDVYARRLSRSGESWLRRKLSLWFYGLLQKFTKDDVLRNVGDFRLLDRKCIDLPQLLLREAAAAYTDVEDAGMELRVEVPEEPLAVYADERQLGRVVANLIANAARHNGPGTVITLALGRRAGVADIVVADTGEPISQDVGELFEPFARGDAARSGGGSGLGLSIAKTIVNMHGYQIHLVQPYGTYTKAFVVTCTVEV